MMFMPGGRGALSDNSEKGGADQTKLLDLKKSLTENLQYRKGAADEILMYYVKRLEAAFFG